MKFHPFFSAQYTSISSLNHMLYPLLTKILNTVLCTFKYSDNAGIFNLLLLTFENNCFKGDLPFKKHLQCFIRISASI